MSIIFGIIGLNQIKKNPAQYRGKWMSIFGIVLSIICIIVYGVMFARVFDAMISNPEFMQQIQEFVNSGMVFYL